MPIVYRFQSNRSDLKNNYSKSPTIRKSVLDPNK